MKSKINITGVSETMLQTLYARAKETNSQNAKIKDDIAVHIVENIDYDFSKADSLDENKLNQIYNSTPKIS